MPCVERHAIDDENVTPISRSFDCHDFGVTSAKRHPAFVFSIRGASCLVHNVARVELHWWRVGGDIGEKLVKLKKPTMIAFTTCGTFFHLRPEIARTCHVPSPDAIPCGRCNGEVAPFGKHGHATKAHIKRQDAHVKLGCAVRGY